VIGAARGLVTETGNMFAITLEALRVMWKPPYPWREFIRQSWFIASVSMFPAVLVSIAFGATIALQGSRDRGRQGHPSLDRGRQRP